MGVSEHEGFRQLGFPVLRLHLLSAVRPRGCCIMSHQSSPGGFRRHVGLPVCLPWDASMCSCCRAFALAFSLSVGWDPEGWTNCEWMSSHQASGHAVQSWRIKGTQVHKGTGQAVLSEMDWAPRIQDRL